MERMSNEDYGKIIAKNIKRLAYENQVSQAEMARVLKVNQSTLSSWMNGTRIPRMDKIDMLCSYFNCRRVDIMEEEPSPAQKHSVEIPIVGRVAAGEPILMVEEIEGYEEIPEKMSRSGNFVALRIHGQSMEPRMCEGDVVIVKEQDDAEDGQIVVACVNGDDATCKKLRRRSGQICLMSNNPAYPPQWYRPGEVDIRGVVVELRAKF